MACEQRQKSIPHSTHARVHLHTHTYMNTVHAHEQTHVCIHTSMHTHACAHARIHTCTRPTPTALQPEKLLPSPTYRTAVSTPSALPSQGNSAQLSAEGPRQWAWGRPTGCGGRALSASSSSPTA